MLVPRPICSHVGGAAPRRIAPDALSLNLRAEMSQQQAMLDLHAAQSIFNTEGLLGGIWLPDLAMMRQDSAGTTAAASGVFVGYVADQSGRGLTASQNTTANKPTLLNWQSTGKYGLFPSADNIALIATFPSSLDSACTEFVTTPDGVEILENRTVGTTYNIADRYFFGRILLNRACSPYEKALFTRMLARYIPKTSLYKYDFAITQTGGGAVDLKIVTASATTVYIEWGDGTGGTVASNTSLSHTYAATYAGAVRVSSLSPITSLTSNNGKWSFNLSRLPATLTYFYCTSASNTIFGNLSSIPTGMMTFYCLGSNTISGNLSGLPSGLMYLYCAGSNTISGNLSSIPSSLVFFVCLGANTIGGDLSSAPSGLNNFYCAGSNTISDYSGKTWATNQQRVYLIPVSPGGLSSAEVDQLLIDLAAAGGTWAADKVVYLKGTNAARTSASDAAVATLQGKGVTVTTH